MINVSDGTSHDDEMSFLKSQLFDPKNAEPAPKDLNTLFDEQVNPPVDANGNEIRASGKPAGALESPPGYQGSGQSEITPVQPSNGEMAPTTTVNGIEYASNVIPLPITPGPNAGPASSVQEQVDKIKNNPDKSNIQLIRPPQKTSDSKDEFTIPLSNIAEAGGALATMFLVPSQTNEPGARGALKYGGSGEYHIIHAESGTKAGVADLKYNPETKNIKVDWVGADYKFKPTGVGASAEKFSSKALEANYNTQKLGMAELATLGPELKRVFPEAESFSGFRISGARRDKPKYVVRPLPELGKVEGKFELPPATRQIPPSATPVARGSLTAPPEFIRRLETPGPGLPSGGGGTLQNWE